MSRRLLHHNLNVDLDNYLKLSKIRYVPIVGAAMDAAYSLYLHEQYKKLVDISVDDQSQWNKFVMRAGHNIRHYDALKENLFKLSILWIGLTGATGILASALYARDGSDHYVGALSILAGLESFLRITALCLVWNDRSKLSKNARLQQPPFKLIHILDQQIEQADV